MAKRVALLVASYEYQDAGLRRLTAPAHDAEALAAVLRDPRIAGFEATILVNAPNHEVGMAISHFFNARRREDLALLYFTGHGLKDDNGRLYLAMSNTDRSSLPFTALSADSIDQALESCVSRQKLLILDCCYSGAFPASRLAKADDAVHTLEKFHGRGRTVLTASDSTQYAFEGDILRGQAAQSVFTRYLVEGLREGTADLDGDGDITVDELYSYVYDRVVQEIPQQRPKKQDDVEGRTVIAQNINWTLPPYLHNALNSPIATDRIGALEGLDRLHRIGNSTVQNRVREVILLLTENDSRQVQAAAVDWLQRAYPSAPTSPAVVPEPSAPAGGELEQKLHRAEAQVEELRAAQQRADQEREEALRVADRARQRIDALEAAMARKQQPVDASSADQSNGDGADHAETAPGPEPEQQDHMGVVTTYDAASGSGFLRRAGSEANPHHYRFHMDTDESASKDLHEGQQVSFEPGGDRNDDRAYQVRPVNGSRAAAPPESAAAGKPSPRASTTSATAGTGKAEHRLRGSLVIALGAGLIGEISSGFVAALHSEPAIWKLVLFAVLGLAAAALVWFTMLGILMAIDEESDGLLGFAVVIPPLVLAAALVLFWTTGYNPWGRWLAHLLGMA